MNLLLMMMLMLAEHEIAVGVTQRMMFRIFVLLKKMAPRRVIRLQKM